jgi:pilus assembly protein Flp/PilA
MLSIFRRLMKNDKGATAIEYALIASLIAVAAVTVMKAVGTGVKNSLQAVSNNLT